MKSPLLKALNAARSILDPRSYLHILRLIHFYGYSHVRERRKLTVGAGAGIAPNVSFRNGERITMGEGCFLGERCFLWAGDVKGRIVLGDHVVVAPGVFITASDYRLEAGKAVGDQTKDERDVRIGSYVWLGTGVVVTAGVSIGDGCVIGAGAVVTHDIPAGSLAGGVPARVIRKCGGRGESSP